jgi:AcrR family transcriptional regulator
MTERSSADTSSPRRHREQRRRLENREAIIHAAEAVILRRGFSATSMDDVAAEADFSKATVYRYFRSKAELLFEIMTHFMDDIEERLAAIRNDRSRSAALRLGDTVAALMGYLAEKENISRVVMADRSFLRLVHLFVDDGAGEPAGARRFVERIKDRRAGVLKGTELLLAEGMKAGEFRSLDPAAVAVYFSAVLSGFLHERLWTEAKPDLKKDVSLISDLLLRGLSVRDEGRGAE